jgi:hypothetical protein
MPKKQKPARSGAKLVQGGRTWQWTQYRNRKGFCRKDAPGAKRVVMRRRNMPGGR